MMAGVDPHIKSPMQSSSVLHMPGANAQHLHPFVHMLSTVMEARLRDPAVHWYMARNCCTSLELMRPHWPMTSHFSSARVGTMVDRPDDFWNAHGG
jgi:hypothetical protein